MEPNNSFNYKISTLELDEKNIINFDANYKMIVLSKQYDSIDVYSMESKKKICSKQFYTDVTHFQLHLK